MDSFYRTHYCFVNLITVVILVCNISHKSAQTNTNYNSLVYTHCANHTSTSFPSALLSPFLQQLVQKSSQSQFFQTHAINDDDDKTAISAQFQCRGDLTPDECHKCVKQLPNISQNLCGETIPARVQLTGCYLHYEHDEMSTTSRMEMLYKTCSETVAVWEGFKTMRDAAFEALLRGVVSGDGYSEIKYERMHVMGQCEGKTGDCECEECVNNAVQIAQDECGYSISAQVYMQTCFVTYTYDDSNKSNYAGNQTTLFIYFF